VIKHFVKGILYRHSMGYRELMITKFDYHSMANLSNPQINVFVSDLQDDGNFSTYGLNFTSNANNASLRVAL
jgi:hypothetical protein